jgi:hypothetical protein
VGAIWRYDIETFQDIDEAGEDLSEQLGRSLEAKVVISNIKKRLK